ncbi:hypothetical protein L0337_42960 [candidate division KSB1 bacterium]|nr:hypothetical protein [candidate division KSB1 bacterium]
MKTSLGCACLVLLLITQAAAEDKFGLALKVGPNFSNMLVREKSTSFIVNTDMRIKPSYMLELEVVITKHLSYVAGFQYLVHAYSGNATDSIYTYEYTRRANFLSIPNKIRVFFHHHKLQSFLSFGVNAETVLSARIYQNYDDPAILTYETNIKVLYSDITFTPELDAGLRLPLAGFFLTLEGTYAHGTETVNNPDLEYLAEYSRKIRDFRFMIGISRYLF